MNKANIIIRNIIALILLPVMYVFYVPYIILKKLADMDEFGEFLTGVGDNMFWLQNSWERNR